jgi:hypothetical protein
VHLAYYKRGLTQERLKQLEAAKASYELAIKLFPESVGAIMAKPSLDRVGPFDWPPAAADAARHPPRNPERLALEPGSRGESRAPSP